MKVLHIPFTYYPDPCGGTETYVRSLVRGLSPLRIESAVCAPGTTDSSSEQEGVRVSRFRPVIAQAAGPSTVFDGILAAERPDIVHFHAYVGGMTAGLAARARERGIPMLYTYHTPTALCARGDLLRMGREVCAGLLEPRVCAGCLMRSKQVPAPIAAAIAALPQAISANLASAIGGRARTALRSRSGLVRHKAEFADFIQATERVVVVCEWARRLLVVNGVSTDKIELCRLGVEGSAGGAGRSDLSGGPRLLYAGRLHASKGVEVLVRAVRALPDADLLLDIRGGAQSEVDRSYISSLKALCSGDPRIRFMEPYAPESATGVMASYDAIAVPSTGIETGPLVVLEAFAAGVPVLASRRGGIVELVRDGIDGYLVEPGDVGDWAQLLRLVTSDPARLRGLRAGVRPPRTMVDVSAQMGGIYERVVSAGVRS